MLTKTILSTVAAAILATSAVSASTTTASAGKYDSAIAGAVFGAAAVIIGASIANDRHSDGRRVRNQERMVVDYDAEDEDCIERPIRRWNAQKGRKVIVGYKMICN